MSAVCKDDGLSACRGEPGRPGAAECLKGGFGLADRYTAVVRGYGAVEALTPVFSTALSPPPRFAMTSRLTCRSVQLFVRLPELSTTAGSMAVDMAPAR